MAGRNLAPARHHEHGNDCGARRVVDGGEISHRLPAKLLRAWKKSRRSAGWTRRTIGLSDPRGSGTRRNRLEDDRNPRRTGHRSLSSRPGTSPHAWTTEPAAH